MRRMLLAGVVLSTLWPQSVQGATITYTAATQAAFFAALGVSITDDYEATTGYPAANHSDAAMSAVLGETAYTTTGFTNDNFIISLGANQAYCGGGGCISSFRLDFDTTSVGTGAGVFGVGFNFFNSGLSLPPPIPPLTGFVTFGDGSTSNIAFPTASTSLSSFFGITSDVLVRSIHFGLLDGGATQRTKFGIDNLTIGSSTAVPEPSTLLLLATGLAMVGVRYRRRKK